ncbi:MAG: hypothetical protein KAY32_08535 [Candidatus Eisenbacteria sp.]|nr:hypothetical protein [Candidatus Eisenbacteria bacterium]
MQCPFLKEATVRYCGIAPVRKLVPRDSIHEDDQRCTTPDYQRCPTAQAHLTGHDGLTECPFLQESLVQYCAAAEVTKFIPCNDSVLSRCNGDNHRHCPLYLQRAHPRHQRSAHDGCLAAPAGRQPAGQIDDDTGEIPTPDSLAFAPSHMWIDVGENGCCDVGIDALLARVLGRVDSIRFVSPQGHGRPRATISIDDLDLPLAFPLRLEITSANALLRVRPETIVSDPYGAGWLFAGQVPCHDGPKSDVASVAGLLQGEAARQWMRTECDRLARFVHDLQAQRCDRGEILMSDGGEISNDLWKHLDREERLLLFDRFFAEPNE